jgi:CheY-like chemotaxis protein
MITIQAGYALVIDDEPANRDFLVRLLQTANFKVIGAETGAEGLRAVKSVPELALALVDQQLPDSSGLEVIKQLRADNPEALLVMATMHDDRPLIDQAFTLGIDVFLVKPHGFMELYRRLKEVDLDTSLLRRLIIDQYGPRPYKGLDSRKGQVLPAIPPPIKIDEGQPKKSTPDTSNTDPTLRRRPPI